MGNIEFGVIEDRHDPEMMGRYRVRVIGVHSPALNDIKTSDLPWATVLMPTTGASVSGIGSTAALVEGSWVGVVFLDEYMQDPIIIGSLPGRPSERRDVTKGFADPNGVYPKYLDEPDVNKLARGTNTIVDNDAAPASAYAAVYPYNKVMETESGHIVEFDDTKDAERIRIVHKSGTSVEMFPNGDIVSRNKNKWQMTTGNEECRISGTLNIVVEGNAVIESPLTTIKGDLAVEGDVTVTKTIIATDEITGKGIALSTHKHTDTAGLGAGITTGPNALVVP